MATSSLLLRKYYSWRETTHFTLKVYRLLAGAANSSKARAWLSCNIHHCGAMLLATFLLLFLTKATNAKF
jgi:hypothetical protein